MFIKNNPMLSFNRIDTKAIMKTRCICDRLIEGLAHFTMTDEACIVCADNGEVFVTEKELYTVLDVLNRMERIVNEAPCDYDYTDRKILAVTFEG